jgi:hypothetical protein
MLDVGVEGQEGVVAAVVDGRCSRTGSRGKRGDQVDSTSI